MHGGGTGRSSIGAGLCFIEKKYFLKSLPRSTEQAFFLAVPLLEWWHD